MVPRSAKARVALLGASCSTTSDFLNPVVEKGIGSPRWVVSGTDGPAATHHALDSLSTALPISLDERRIYLSLNETRVIQNLTMKGNGCLDPLDNEFGQSSAHAGQGFCPSRLINQKFGHE